MTDLIAGLPMYDWPEARAAVDAQWERLRDALTASGIEAPARLVRRNADLPAVPGGIRDAEGKLIAPDPATLPPDALDFRALWLHPKLLIAQTCWGPMEQGLAENVQVVGQPSYDGIDGGQGELYSSAILTRRPPSPLWGGSDRRSGVRVEDGLHEPVSTATRSAQVIQPRNEAKSEPAPADGRAVLPLDRMRSARLAYNSPDSMSGIIALTRDLEAVRETLEIFPDRLESGAHRASIIAVAQGRADLCAVDCQSWAMALEHEPAAGALEVVGWTARRKGLPYIMSRTLPDLHAKAVAALSHAGGF